MAEQHVTLRVGTKGEGDVVKTGKRVASEADKIAKAAIKAAKEQERAVTKAQREEERAVRAAAKAAAEAAKKKKAASEAVKKSWLDTAAKLTIVLHGVSKIFGMLYRSMTEPMKAAAKFAKDSAQLDVALSRLGQDVDKTRASFDSFASELQRTAGVSMDTVTSMQRLWVQLTGNADGANKATRAAMELSAVLGIDGTSAMRMMSQAAEGNVQTLARYVPAVRDLTQEQIKAGEAIDLVAEKFGGALSANMDNVAGQWERLNNIIMDRYREASALAIIQNEAISAGLKMLGDDLIVLSSDYESVGQLAKELAIMTANALSGIASLVGGIATSVNSVMSVLNDVVRAGLEPILKMLDGLMMIWRKAGKFLGLPEGVIEGFDAFGETLKDIVRTPLDIGETIEELSGKVADMSSTAVVVLDRVSAAMTRTATSTKKASDDAAQSIKKLVAVTQEAAVQEGLIFTRLEDYKQSVLASNRAEYVRLGEESAAAAAEAHEEYVARVIKAEELSRAAQEQTRAAIRRGAAAMMDGAETLGNAMFAVADGAMTAAEAARHLAVTAANAMIDSVLAVVQAKLVEAMVSAMAGHAGIPLVGYAIGAAAAATVAGAIKALIAKIERPRGFYFGGTATGGIPGRDSVPAMLRPDERVLTPHQAEQQEAIAAMAGGGSTLQVVVNAPLGMGDSVAVMRQYERALLPALERMARTGRLDRALAMAGAR